MLKDIRRNPILLTDCYNLSHQDLKVSTDWEVSHFYNRSECMYLYGFNEIVRSILEIQITREMVNEAEQHAVSMNLTFPRDLWMRVVNECNGYAPLLVEALPEGTWCPRGTPFAQIKNTVEGFGELVTWWEGCFMMAYFPSACATEAFAMRRYLVERQEQFGYDASFLNKFHSFGYRGHTSLESAYWAGTAWNLALFGTDDFHTKQHTLAAQIGSIAALAHKVTQQFDKELDCFKRAIDKAKESKMFVVALVIDTYDAYRVINEYLVTLAGYANSKGVHIVLRPDSGDTWKQAVDIYRICSRLNIKNVSVIIGESMSFENAKKCDEYLLQNGVPLNFVFYGIGAGFYKHIERDTLGWAMKTAYSNGKPRMKFSMEPIKRSIPGEVKLIKKGKDMFVVPKESEPEFPNLFTVIYYHDNLDLSKLIIDVPHMIASKWIETQTRALKQDISQKAIYISSEISELIAQFETTYKG